MVRRFLLFVWLLGGAVQTAALAQSESPNPPSPSDSAAEGSAFAETLVVTATLEEEERDGLPFTVDVLDAEEIGERQATEIADLLGTVAGLTVIRSGSPGQVTSLFTRGTESDHTLVLWNGIELNNPFFGGYDWAFLPTQGVERIEIARGPFSATHGSDAIGGVVHVLSGGADGSGSGSLRLEGGDDGYFRGGLVAGVSAGRARLDVFGHVRQGDGELDNDFYDSEELVARADWSLGEHTHLGLTARVNDSDVGIATSSGLPSPNRRIAWKERELAVPFKTELGAWKLDAQVSRTEFESAFSDPDDAFGFTFSDTESESVRARARGVYGFEGEGWLAVGGEYERLEVDDRSVFGVSLVGARQKTRSLFAEVFYPVGAANLDLGLRHDDNDVFGSRTSPRLGVSVAIGESTRLRAAYGEAFRAPSLGELFFPFSGNGELRPEESESYELGFVATPGRWELGITGFRNELSQLIDFDFVTARNFNIGRARTEGVEAQVAYGGERFDVRWNATQLEAEDRDTGLPLLRRPEESASLLLALRGERWRTRFTGRYVGSRADFDAVTFARIVNGGYVRFDLAGQWRLTDRLMPYARIENLADREYEEASGFPAPGRTLIGGLEVSWE